jgi:hypothetical protein
VKLIRNLPNEKIFCEICGDFLLVLTIHGGVDDGGLSGDK